LRACEQAGRFDEPFIELARGVYHHNDGRSVLKRRLNDLLGSPVVEEKSYPVYGAVVELVMPVFSVTLGDSVSVWFFCTGRTDRNSNNIIVL
jgi:hypothetical protein